MILAAGYGKRMRPLTDHLPKPLIPIAGKSMLTRTLEHLDRAGIQSLVLNTHYLASQLHDFVGMHCPHAQISHEETLLETGGGIKKALPLLGHEPFFVLNGDSVWTGPDSLKDMKKLWDEAKMDVLLLLIPHERAHGYTGNGDFHLLPDGRLTRPKEGESASYVYIGVQYIHPRLFNDVPEGIYSMNLLWDQALTEGRLYGYVHNGEWYHISTPEDVERYSPMIVESDKQVA